MGVAETVRSAAGPVPAPREGGRQGTARGPAGRCADQRSAQFSRWGLPDPRAIPALGVPGLHFTEAGPRNLVYRLLAACGQGGVSAESGDRLTRRAREEYRVYFDRSATMSVAEARFSGDASPLERRVTLSTGRACGQGGVSAEARRPADKAREGGIPGVFRPKRNDERLREARFSGDASPLERRVTLSTGC